MLLMFCLIYQDKLATGLIFKSILVAHQIEQTNQNLNHAYLSLCDHFFLRKISRIDFCVTFLSSPGRRLSSVHFLFLDSLSLSALCLRSLSSADCMYGELMSSPGSLVPDLLHSSRKGTNIFLLDLLMNAMTAP